VKTLKFLRYFWGGGGGEKREYHFAKVIFGTTSPGISKAI